MNHLTFNVVKTDFGSYNLNVSFGETVLVYDLSDFFRDISFIETLYEPINRYVSTLHISTQEEVFNTFLKLYEQRDTIDYLHSTSVDKIENKIAKVIRLLNLNNFKMWLNWEKDKFFMPETIKDEFIFDPDLNVIKEKTYTRNEYIELIAIITLMRATLPLYIDYFNYIRHVTEHFYYRLFQLFIKSDIYESTEMLKLREYVENIQKSIEENSKIDYLVINKGFSTDDIIDNIIAEIIFTKLITNDFYNKKNNIISFIFQTIRFKVKYGGAESGNIISKVNKTDSDKDDMSYFEDYRKTSEISIGNIVEIQYALEDTNAILSVIGVKNFDVAMYENELNKVRALLNNKIHKTQIILLGWIFHKYINPRALYYIEVKKLVELLALAKTVLWQKEHFFLAILLTSYKSSTSDYMNIIIRNNVNRIHLEPIEGYYKFLLHEKKSTLLEKTIAEVVKEITTNTWIPTSSSDELSKIKSKSNVLTIPNDIFNQVVRLVQDVDL